MARTPVGRMIAANSRKATDAFKTPGLGKSVSSRSDRKNLGRNTAYLSDFDDGTFRQLQDVLQPDRLAVHLQTLKAGMTDLVAGGSSPEKLTSSAHSMISQAGMFGFVRLSGLSRQLEGDLEAGKDVALLLASVRSAVAVARSWISKLQAEDRRLMG